MRRWAMAKKPKAESVDYSKVDGRSLRRIGRTHQFATRIKEATHAEMKRIAARDGITLAELIERAVEVYERKEFTKLTS